MKRKQTNQIYLKEPKFEELWYRKQLLGDEKNMTNYKGVDLAIEGFNIDNGTIDFDETCWSEWYRKWLKPGDENHFYAYIVRKEDDKFLGETYYVFDENEGSFNSDIVLEESARNLGYAGEVVDLLIMNAFDNGQDVFYTVIPREHMSWSLFTKRKFKEIRPDKTLSKNGKDYETVLIGVDKKEYMRYMYGNSIKWNIGHVFKKLFA